MNSLGHSSTSNWENVKTDEQEHILYDRLRAHFSIDVCALVFHSISFSSFGFFLEKEEKRAPSETDKDIFKWFFYMDSLWPSANVVNATIPWSSNDCFVCLLTFFVVCFVHFFGFRCRCVSLLLSGPPACCFIAAFADCITWWIIDTFYG